MWAVDSNPTCRPLLICFPPEPSSPSDLWVLVDLNVSFPVMKCFFGVQESFVLPASWLPLPYGLSLPFPLFCNSGACH